MKYYIFTLGCQMNKSDSERIAKVLESCGFKSAPTEEGADLIVINACSVRQAAVDRIYGKIKKWQSGKQNKKIVITGCILPLDRHKLHSKVDLIFDIKDLPNLPKMLSIPSLLPITHHPLLRNKREALIPIMTGCNNFCSYCAVPYTRGREISRPEEEIINEVKQSISRGIKKVVLLGQNVNNYGLDLKNTSFVQLLKKIIGIPGNFQISFLTSNPWNFPDQLIELIAKEPKLIKEVHLPIQSGDDEILKKMNRNYTSGQYLALISKLKSHFRPKGECCEGRVSNLYLSTDIIVGFPTETKKAFENTVKVCKQARFNKAYIAQYSPRPGTVSAKLYKDDVPKTEKKRRWQILNNLINS
ncbi:MAG: MiaB/RimO family radical SAM methylthiotransferase [Candidatus Berkelbacteria bacterium]|nr:MiaB/RimO family radical SAM methylthiotransferase [Candidatus Berkelbacteria bacterium]